MTRFDPETHVVGALERLRGRKTGSKVVLMVKLCGDCGWVWKLGERAFSVSAGHIY